MPNQTTLHDAITAAIDAELTEGQEITVGVALALRLALEAEIGACLGGQQEAIREAIENNQQWCELHDCAFEDPAHDYKYPECEQRIRDMTAAEQSVAVVGVLTTSIRESQ